LVKSLVYSFVSFIHIFATFVMTWFLILFMFLVIMFIVYFDYMLSIVRIIIVFMHKFAKRSVLCTFGVSGRHCVSMVLIRFLPADALDIPDRVIDRGGDSLVESFVVHLPFVGQVGRGCDGSQALFWIFLSNVPYV
jgi:hypothetical protein